MSELYISDLDGTLLNRNVEISEKTAEILNKLIDKGMNFTVATARTLASAGKILSNVRLKLPIILMNGVLIYNPLEKKYEVVNSLSEKLRATIQHFAKKIGLDCFMYTIKGNDMMTYFERLSSQAMQDFYNERREKYYKSFIQVDNFSEITDDVIYFTFISEYERLSPLYKELSQNPDLEITFYRDIYSENLWYLEAFSAKASKQQGVRYLREKYGFDNISVFGDNLNDLPMFDEADKKYAVENAVEQVKIVADEIILSNENDGVAMFLLNEFGKEGIYG